MRSVSTSSPVQAALPCGLCFEHCGAACPCPCHGAAAPVEAVEGLRYFAVVKDGCVIASTASASRHWKFAVVYSRRDVIWRTTREGAAQQAGFMGDRDPEIVDVVETPRLLEVGERA